MTDESKPLEVPEGQELTISTQRDQGVDPGFFSVVFNDTAEEVLRFEQNGDIYVRGELVENNKQVVEGMKVFLLSPSAEIQVLRQQIFTLALWVTQEYDAGRMDNVESGRANIREHCRQAMLLGVKVTETPTEVSDGESS